MKSINAKRYNIVTPKTAVAAAAAAAAAAYRASASAQQLLSVAFCS